MKLENVMIQWAHLASPQDGYYKVEIICTPDQAERVDAEIDACWEKWQKKEKSTKSPAWTGGRKPFEKELPVLEVSECLELAFREDPDLDLDVAEWLEKKTIAALKQYKDAHKSKKLVSFVLKQAAERENKIDGTVQPVESCVYKRLGTEKFAPDKIPLLSNGSICIVGFEPFVSQYNRNAGITLGLRSVQPLLYTSFSGDSNSGIDITKLAAQKQ